MRNRVHFGIDWIGRHSRRGAEIVARLDCAEGPNEVSGTHLLLAVGRRPNTITFADTPVEAWRDSLLERGLPVHLVSHLSTMADLHRPGRYHRVGSSSEACGDIHRVGNGGLRVEWDRRLDIFSLSR